MLKYDLFTGFIIVYILFWRIVFSLIALFQLTDEQDYIELCDEGITLCSWRLLGKIKIVKAILFKKEKETYLHYHWNDLENVEMKLINHVTSAMHLGLHTVYEIECTYHFSNGIFYQNILGASFTENSKIAYQILRNKNIEIIDYFEAIYHKNTPENK